MAIRWELDKAKHGDTYRQVMLQSAKPNPIARVTISIIRWSALGGRCFSLFLASFSSGVYIVSTGYTKLKGVKTMAITERKLRKVGNSTVVTLSKDFLDSMGMSESDTVIIDEEKLKEAMVKKVEKDEDQLLVEMSMAKMSKQYEETFKALVTK